MAWGKSIVDLPSDILYLIFPYLSAVDYLRLTTCTRWLSTYRDDSIVWHALTRQTFRIPNQPLLRGLPWQRLYKKLSTQTQLYTWGNDSHGNLGHERLVPNSGMEMSQLGTDVGIPKPVYLDDRVGIVADVQCGGWSTTVLNSTGEMFMFGVFDGHGNRRDGSGSRPRKLGFPLAYPQTTRTRYEPSTAIRQYSTGRASVLGLADDNKVWMWESDMAFQVKPTHVDLTQNKVKRVVAGWDCCSMFVLDVGIVYWTSTQDSAILRGGRQEAFAIADMMLIDSLTVPGTGYRRTKAERFTVDGLETRVGEVKNHVVLAQYIVFTTDLNKVFCYPITFHPDARKFSEPIELTTFYSASGSDSFKIRDVQGAFGQFAVFTDDCILAADLNLLQDFISAHGSSLQSDTLIKLPSPTLMCSPKSQTIISLAFGDHHFHAIHSNGTITSYGHEPQRSSAFGLGPRDISSRLRGMRNSGLPESEARTVWFEPLMATWLRNMYNKSLISTHMLDSGHEGASRAYGDYFEKEGAKWEDSVTKDGEMGAYFVLKVAAAGWSSAALVLVDEEKAEKAREAHIIRPSPKKPPPSPTPSTQSSEDSYEVVESPGEQLTAELYAIYTWLWELGRWFLGLTARDAAINAEEARREEVREMEMKGRVEYTWNEEPFPRLMLPDGDSMDAPGDIPAD